MAKVLDELAAEDAIFTCDVGTPTIWAARYLHMNGKRRLLGSFNHGSMANALPQAIGAQVSHPGRQVVSLSGDGGLAMLMGDLLSLRQLRLPVKLIVFNNSSLAFVELEMKAAGLLDFGTDLENPNFAKMADAAGILGLRAETADQVRPMIEQALQHDGPALVEAIVSRQELSMPPTLTIDQIKGFGLFMIKAVLDGAAARLSTWPRSISAARSPRLVSAAALHTRWLSRSLTQFGSPEGPTLTPCFTAKPVCRRPGCASSAPREESAHGESGLLCRAQEAPIELADRAVAFAS